MQRTQLDDIIRFISKPLAEIGLECLEVEWVQDERILRLFIDRADGVVIDDCVTASRVLENLTELDQQVDGAYHLEVSSPGVERPLRTLEHFESHLGKRAEAILLERVGDRKHGVGVIAAVERGPERVTIATNRGDWQFPLDRLSSCRLKFDWQ